MSYSGWAQAYGAIGRAEAAYFRMINDRGGVNGRKISFISVNNGSQAANSLELAQHLVQHDGVLLIFGALGTETNLAIRPYLNEQHVPQLFVNSSSVAFNDPAHFPWTMGFFASLRTEGMAYARYILQTKPSARIAILYADDDAGREYLAGEILAGLGPRASSMVLSQLSYRPADAQCRSAAHGAQGFRRRRVPQLRSRAVCHAGDSQGLRSGLASAAVHRQRVAIDRRVSGSGRTRQGRGHHHQRALQRLAGTSNQERSGGARVRGLDAAVQPGGQPARSEQRRRLRARRGAGRAAATMRRQSTRANIMQQARTWIWNSGCCARASGSGPLPATTSRYISCS